MRTGDTIVAIATGPGRSARCILRLSGSESQSVLECLGMSVPERRGAHRVKINWDSSRRLPALLLWMPGPESYTGEDCAELQLPGSRVVADHFLQRLLSCENVRLAEPGEFSARAYFHERLTIEQAEGIAWLIAAGNDAELAAAREVLDGVAGQRAQDWCETIASALALVEAGIDFTDQEDVVAITPDALLGQITKVRSALDDQLSGSHAALDNRGVPRVVLAGVPSAGKSTLFNALLGRSRAVVNEEPGTTRDVLREMLDLNDIMPGWGVELQDLPGLDASPGDDAARAAQHACLGAMQSADVLVWCDPTGQFSHESIPESGAVIVRVRTKADLPVGVSDTDMCRVCALDGWGISPLRRAISDAAWSRTHTRAGAAMQLLPRHEHVMREAMQSLVQVVNLVEPEKQSRSLPDSELVAGLLREALDALGQIAGAIDPDDIIGRVFASFCVGK